MKNVVLKICSVLIILASIFGLAGAGLGVKDALAVKAFMEGDGTSDPVKELTDGLKLLGDNESAYKEGIITYKDGLVQLADGEKELAAGKAQLAQGYKDYAAGKAELAAGQKLIDENTQAYNEGKETLAQIEPLLPVIETYQKFRDGTIANLPGFSTAQEYFMKVVRPLAKEADLDIPENENDLVAYIQNMVTDGKAQLKEYEDGLVALADGKKQLAQGEKDLADGEKQVADGEAQLADGKQQLKEGRAQLKEYEDGIGQIKDGLDEVLSQKSYSDKNGNVVVKNPSMTVGEDFDYYEYDKNGKPVMMLDGNKLVSLKQATKVRDALATYVDDVTAGVTKELVTRIVLYLVLALASLCGLLAGIRGLLGKGFVPGLIAAILGVGANIAGIATDYRHYMFLLEDGSANGSLQFAAMVVFAVVAVGFAVVAKVCKTKKVEE